MDFHHISVLRDESIDYLNILPDGIYADATLGGGGHSFEIVKKLTSGKLIGFDRDIDAINAASERLSIFKDKTTFVNRNFKDVKDALSELGISKINGAVMDLGVSSYQLDNAERGFSYMHDAPLDMRMDRRESLSAFDIVNGYSKEELKKIIRDYGEENWADRIAEFIVKERQDGNINTTYELVEVIKKAVPKGARRDGPHPAKRTFQAIRIEVNGELRILENAIRDFVECLEEKGRLCIITFHSLEDRIVKNTFSTLATGCTCPKEFPVCVCGNKPQGKVITRKPVLPSNEELEFNPRARSAKLRVFEKI